MANKLPFWVVPAMVALVLRFAGALFLRPWHDEYFTAWLVDQSIPQMLAALRWDSGPPLPYLLAKLLAGLGLSPLTAARALSAVAGTVAAVLLGLAVSQSQSLQAGQLASWLAALHPLAIIWGSEGRAYSLVTLAGAGSLWALPWTANTRKNHWLALAGFLALGLYTHALGLLWLFAVLIFSWYRRYRPGFWACGAAAMVWGFWLPVMLQQPPEAVAWMARVGQDLPLWTKLLGPLRLLPPLAGWGYTLEAPEPFWLLQVISAVGTIVVLLRARVSWFLFLLPASLLWLGWLVGLPVFFPGRGEALFLPAFLAVLAYGLERWQKIVKAGFLALCLAGCLAVLFYWKHRPPRPEEEVARFLQATTPAGQLVTTGWWWLSMHYWLPSSWHLVHVPATALRHPGWYVPGQEKPSAVELREVKALLATAPVIAVLVTPGLPEAEAIRQAARQQGLAPVLRVSSGVLYLRQDPID